MHRSRIGGLIIDCQTGDLESAVNFWGAALGLQRRASKKPEDANYVVFETAPNELDIEVQKVDHPSRVHIDIETDDIEAEARRLENLGARRVAKVRSWWVMQAPSGQRFCVVSVQRSGFASEANVWE
jgi:predicted enzyme related to lactoylglutathione lyase